MPPQIIPGYDTPPANYNHANSVVFAEHDWPLGTDTGGEYIAGRLALREGCLRVEIASNGTGLPPSSRLLIWPSGFTFQTNLGAGQVIDRVGRIVARVGDNIRLSRAGFSFQEAAERGLVKGLSQGCTEPYFLVGDEVTAFDPENEANELRLSDPDVLLLREKTVITSGLPLLQALGLGERNAAVSSVSILRIRESTRLAPRPARILQLRVHHAVRFIIQALERPNTYSVVRRIFAIARMSIVNLNITRIHRDMVPLHGVEEAKTTLLTSRSFLEYKVAKPVDVIFFHLGINIQRSRNAPVYQRLVSGDNAEHCRLTADSSFNMANSLYDGRSHRLVTSTRSRNQQSVGDYVCKYGKVTYYTCGNILTKHYQLGLPYGGNVWIRVHKDGVVMSLDGDRGAPWFNGYTAHGILHGGFYSGDWLYMAINYIDILGLTVITDSD